MHKLIIIGASSGGVEAVAQIVGALPANLPAAVCVVVHMSAHAPGLLAEVLGQAGRLTVRLADDGMRIERGCIYVPPPDHHLLVWRGQLRVIRGPRENGFRPSVDALFRTAARAYGPRVIAGVLTGMLDDGTAGALAVKSYGGQVLVQDPGEARFPSMPRSVIRYVPIDAVLPLEMFAPALVRTQCRGGPAADQASVPDDTPWWAYNDLSEQINLARRLAQQARALGDKVGVRRFELLAATARSRRDRVLETAIASQGEVGEVT